MLTAPAADCSSANAAFARMSAASGEAPALPQVVRVFLCDDVPEFRALMRFALEEDRLLEVVGEAGDGSSGVQGVADTQPDVVLLDLSMPACDGLQAIPRIRQLAPGCAIIVLSGLRADPIAPQVLALGAQAYLEKGESFAAIRAAVHETARASGADEHGLGGDEHGPAN